MGNRGRNIMWTIAFILCFPTGFISLLIAQLIEDKYYFED